MSNYKELINDLESCFKNGSDECDGAFCMGCWKDIVRDVIKKLSAIPSELEQEDSISDKIIDLHDNHGYFQGDDWRALKGLISSPSPTTEEKTNILKESVERTMYFKNPQPKEQGLLSDCYQQDVNGECMFPNCTCKEPKEVNHNKTFKLSKDMIESFNKVFNCDAKEGDEFTVLNSTPQPKEVSQPLLPSDDQIKDYAISVYGIIKTPFPSSFSDKNENARSIIIRSAKWMREKANIEIEQLKKQNTMLEREYNDLDSMLKTSGAEIESLTTQLEQLKQEKREYKTKL